MGMLLEYGDHNERFATVLPQAGVVSFGSRRSLGHSVIAP